jgi:hypothetical protein
VRFRNSRDSDTLERFTDEEIAEAFEAAKLKAAAEKKAAKRKALADKALQLSRIEAGLTPAAVAEKAAVDDRMNEMVTWRCDLPDEGHGIHMNGLRVDQMIYVNGTTYTTTRAVFETARDIMYKASLHEAQFAGHTRSYYNRQRGRFEGYGGGAPAGAQGNHAG